MDEDAVPDGQFAAKFIGGSFSQNLGGGEFFRARAAKGKSNTSGKPIQSGFSDATACSIRVRA